MLNSTQVQLVHHYIYILLYPRALHLLPLCASTITSLPLQQSQLVCTGATISPFFGQNQYIFSRLEPPTTKPIERHITYNQVGSCMDLTECLAVLERHREQQHSADLGGRCEENSSRCRAAGSKAVGKNSGEDGGPAWQSISDYVYW